MNAISADTRRRAVTAYLRGDGTQKEIARLFSVSPNSLGTWVREHRNGGDLSPKAYKSGPSRLLAGEGESLLRVWVTAEPDLYERELAERLATEGFVVDRSTVGRALRKMGLSRKKDLRRR